MKTYHKKGKKNERAWHLIDLDSKVLGRVATEIAIILMGKDKPDYSPHLDAGDYVVCTNAKKIVLTGKKAQQKVYQGHSGYPGGFKEISFAKMIDENPERVIKHAVSGMLPKNKLQAKRLLRLKVFEGKDHKYEDKFKVKK